MPVGDVDGSGSNDIGLVSINAFNPVSFSTALNYHITGGVSFSADNRGSITNDLTADVSFDAATPFFGYANSINEYYSLRAAGNLNLSGGSDVVMIDQSNGHRLAFYAGLPSGTPNNTFSQPQAITVAGTTMALPLNEQTVIRHASSIDLNSSTAPVSIGTTPSISVQTANQQLTAPRSVGDINGDGQADFAWETTENVYVAYGPLDIQSGETLAEAADLIVNRYSDTPFPNLIAGHGRLLPSSSQHDDLLFYRVVSINAQRSRLELSAIRGGQTLPRDLDSVRTLGSLSGVARYKTTSIDVNGLANVSITAVDWNHDSVMDFAVFEGGGFVIPKLSIYDGATIASTTGTASPIFSFEIPNATSIQNIGDFTGDGLEDLLVMGFVSGWRATLISGGSGFFIPLDQSSVITAPFNSASVLIAGPTVYPLGDIGTWTSTSSSGQRDGYNDIAIFDPYANQLVIYDGGTSGLVARSTISGGAEFSLYRMHATGGDFDGDGLGDVAIVRSLSSTSGAANQTTDGTAYFFSNIAGRSRSLTLADANRTITSSSTTGVLDSISTSPFNDINGDGLNDLLLGARFADISTDSGVMIDAGRTFAVLGSAKRTALPDDFEVWPTCRFPAVAITW